jgi:hypothetical protein
MAVAALGVSAFETTFEDFVPCSFDISRRLPGSKGQSDESHWSACHEIAKDKMFKCNCPFLGRDARAAVAVPRASSILRLHSRLRFLPPPMRRFPRRPSPSVPLRQNTSWVRWRFPSTGGHARKDGTGLRATLGIAITVCGTRCSEWESARPERTLTGYRRRATVHSWHAE